MDYREALAETREQQHRRLIYQSTNPSVQVEVVGWDVVATQVEQVIH